MRKLTPVLAITVLLLVGAAGCGAGGSSGSSTTTTAKTKAGGETTSPIKAGSDTPESYAKALAKGLTDRSRQSTIIEFDEAQASCLAPKWVKIIGVGTFTAKKVSPSVLAAGGFQFASLGLDQGQASKMIGAIDGCGVDTIKKFRAVLETGLDATKAACLDAGLTDATARQLLEESLYREKPSDELKNEITRLDTTCKLTSGEPPTTGG